MDKLQDKRTLIIFLLVVLAFVLFLWMVLPGYVRMPHQKSTMESVQEMEHRLQEMEQHMEQEQREHFVSQEGKEEQISKQVVANDAPFINPQTGSLIDGPGFEKGEVDGVSVDSLASVPSNYYFLDDGAGGEMSIQHNLCSKSCCSEQWPTPFKQKNDPYVCGNKGQFVPSNYFCNNAFQDSGCLCLTKKQSQFLNNRGGNGRELF